MSMKTVHFVVIATLGLLKTVLSAKVSVDSISREDVNLSNYMEALNKFELGAAKLY